MELENGQFVDKKQDETSFNGAIATLMRIDQILRDITAYRVNHHILGYKNNLQELLFESQGFLDKDEYAKSWRDWNKIKSYKLDFDDDGNVIYDDILISELDSFNAWLRLKLHRHKVTMTTKTELDLGISKIKRKYGI